MCGIAGLATNFFGQQDVQVMRELLIMAAFRGWDSTGVVNLEKTGKHKRSYIKTTWDKDIGHPVFFMNNAKTDAVFRPVARAMFGHARAATKGDVTKANAHPFSKPNVIGVHNGTISYEFEGSKNFQTDSEALYQLINDKGITEALQILERGAGLPAYALVYYDRTDNTLNLIRNDKRPLFMAFDPGQTTMYFASEPAMYHFVLSRRSINISAVERYKSQSLVPHRLYKFRLLEENYLADFETEDIDVGRKVYAAASYTQFNGGQVRDPLVNKDGATGTTGTASANKNVPVVWNKNLQIFETYEEQAARRNRERTNLSPEATSRLETAVRMGMGLGPESLNVIPFSYDGFNGNKLTRKEMEKALLQGCSWCEFQPELFQCDDCSFIDPLNNFICPECKLLPEIQQMFNFRPGEIA